MPILQAIPILAYLDKEETLQFYRSLGFACHGDWEDYIITTRDEIEVHLWRCDDPGIPRNTGCYLRVSGVETLYAECRLLDCVHPHGTIEDKPWGMRQFSILDNSGNILHFGTPI
jgi:hypothetical protein